MTSFLSSLPSTINAYKVHADSSVGDKPVAAKNVPKYGERQGYAPSKPEDYGDGGAFPEVRQHQHLHRLYHEPFRNVNLTCRSTWRSFLSILERIGRLETC